LFNPIASRLGLAAAAPLTAGVDAAAGGGLIGAADMETQRRRPSERKVYYTCCAKGNAGTESENAECGMNFLQT
jgi:hypothetical protein